MAVSPSALQLRYLQVRTCMKYLEKYLRRITLSYLTFSDAELDLLGEKPHNRLSLPRRCHSEALSLKWEVGLNQKFKISLTKKRVYLVKLTLLSEILLIKLL